MIDKKMIEQYLINEGITPKHDGFNVLVNAIMILIEHPEYNSGCAFSIAAQMDGYKSWQCAYRAARYALQRSQGETMMTVGRYVMYVALEISVSGERNEEGK